MKRTAERALLDDIATSEARIQRLEERLERGRLRWVDAQMSLDAERATLEDERRHLAALRAALDAITPVGPIPTAPEEATEEATG